MSHTIRTHRKHISFAAIAAIAVAALGIGFSQAGAQEAAALQVGSYQPQEAFQQYYRTAEFQQEIQQMQEEVQGADPEQQQQQMQQLQQQAQQMQQELIEEFQREVEEAMPGIAEEAGVQLVAVEVVYSADEVEVEDLTDTVIEAINEGAGDGAQQEQQELPPLPQ